NRGFLESVQRWASAHGARERAEPRSSTLKRAPQRYTDLSDYTRTEMDVHVVDGTYELFRYFYAVPPARDANGREVGAVRGVLWALVSVVEQGSTHIGVATDQVIESFRNGLYPGYKTGEGVDPALLSEFPILEEALDDMGVVVWPMVEFEADDALASAAS